MPGAIRLGEKVAGVQVHKVRLVCTGLRKVRFKLLHGRGWEKGFIRWPRAGLRHGDYNAGPQKDLAGGQRLKAKTRG